MNLFQIKPPIFKSAFCSLLLAASSFIFNSCDSRKNVAGPDSAQLDVVAYLFSSGEQWEAAFDTLNSDGVTILNLAFVDPDPQGNFENNESLKSLVQKAHAKKMKVFFSIGGGDPPPQMATLIQEANRTAFATAIANFANSHLFDGVDIDLENDLINDDYAPFIAAVSKVMKAENKKMTAALASWNANKIHDSTLSKFDMIHIMSYDKTGPWSPDRPGPHSPLSMASDDLNYFGNNRAQAYRKLTVGLPFYGYGFGSGAASSLSFRAIAEQYPESVEVDEISLPAGGNIYYNGKATIREKVKLAKERGAAGVMIWQLGGDAKAPHSLLNQIRESLKQ